MLSEKPRFTWFSNNHESSVQYLKFGLMRLARSKAIRFADQPTTQATDWLPRDLREKRYRRLVLIGAEYKGNRALLAADGEDSPFQLDAVLKRVERYYTCTYCPHLFADKRFAMALPWQTAEESQIYADRAAALMKELGDHFAKVKPLGPIGPELEPKTTPSRLRQKLTNVRNKVSLALRGSKDWESQHQRFEQRWQQINNYRYATRQWDIVLLDSLWGWPYHRIELHKSLKQLGSQGFSIRGELRHMQSESCYLGGRPQPPPEDFPLRTGEPIGTNYEELLSQSRLGLFATGFHYGWRNITTLAWSIGLKTFQDPFTYGVGFDPSAFCTTGNVTDPEAIASAITEARRETAEVRAARCAHFDQQASPEAVANRFVNDVMTSLF